MELVLERVHDVTDLARTRMHLHMVSKYLWHHLPAQGILQNVHDIRLAQRVIGAWKCLRTRRVASWMRKRVRTDETPILPFDGAIL